MSKKKSRYTTKPNNPAPKSVKVVSNTKELETGSTSVNTDSKDNRSKPLFQYYELDHIAQTLVLKHQSVAKESHDMRKTVAYGLERFWGESHRLGSKKEGAFWKEVLVKLREILKKAGIHLPEMDSEPKKVAEDLWKFAQDHPYEQRVTLTVLVQLCDSLVWWTQRYK